MNKDSNKSNVSFTQKKLIAKILKHYPTLEETDISKTLQGIRRAVNLIQKIQKEPQVQIIYKNKMVNGEDTKQRIIQTDLEEVKKLIDENRSYTIKEIATKLSKHYPERKYGRRSKKV